MLESGWKVVPQFLPVVRKLIIGHQYLNFVNSICSYTDY